MLKGRLEPLLRSLLVQPEEEADGHWSTPNPEAEGAASDPLAAIRAALQGQPSTTPLHVQCADGRHRCLLLSLSRFIYESKAYIAALLHDMNWPQAPLAARPPKIGGPDLCSLYHHRARAPAPRPSFRRVSHARAAHARTHARRRPARGSGSTGAASRLRWWRRCTRST